MRFTTPCILLVATTTALDASPAFASIVEIEVFPDGTLVPGHVTYQVYATYDDPQRRTLFVGADPEIAPFALTPISGDTTIHNDGGTLAGLGFEDLLLSFAGPGDSYFDIGPIPGNASISDGFLGWAGPEGPSVLQGTELFEDEAGGWHTLDPSTPDILDGFFIQLTLPVSAVSQLSGTVMHAAPGGDPTSEEFSTVLPTGPGGVLLLSLAFGPRRRRA